MFLPFESPVERARDETSVAGRLSVRQLEILRERIRRSIDRTGADFDRIEALLVAAKLRAERRGGESAWAEIFGGFRPRHSGLERIARRSSPRCVP